MQGVSKPKNPNNPKNIKKHTSKQTNKELDKQSVLGVFWVLAVALLPKLVFETAPCI